MDETICERPCMDETACESPWDDRAAVVNQAAMAAPVLVGSLVLALRKPRMLLLYLPAAVVFVTAWRKLVCARCRHYGKRCATLLGVMTARMMPRDGTKALDRNAMIADFTYIGVLAALPLRQAHRSRRLGVLYLLSLAVGMGFILFNACNRCDNDFCPMKDLHRLITGSKRDAG